METRNTSQLDHRQIIRLRGAASVEAVVILPVLVILLASVHYVRNQSIAKASFTRLGEGEPLRAKWKVNSPGRLGKWVAS